MIKQNLYVKGMHGLGDNIHQRAVMRDLCKSYNVFLETSWPQVYHDFPDIRFIAKGTNLRTQLKNQKKHFEKFIDYHRISKDMRYLSISYAPEWIRKSGSVLKAMLFGTETKEQDFSLPVPTEWFQNISKINTHGKPVLIYRPLVDRKEWSGCKNRNPDIKAYFELFNSLRKDFFVISIADLEPNVEWITSLPIIADLEFHKGELSLEDLAALFKSSNLVYCAPGFSAVLAKAVGTPVITIFGGYENSSSFSSGNSPYLGIDTIAPCQCFSHTHPCVKIIDLIAAKKKIGEFLANITKSKN